MVKFNPFHGTVTRISDFTTGQNDEGCYQLMTVEDGAGGIVNFVISPLTYFVDHTVVAVGDRVTGYYDVNAPAILIYPPQYPALVMVKDNPYQSVKVDFFDSQLMSSDGQLRLNITPYTQIVLRNGQPFLKSPANRNLIVIYSTVTMSIPAQTTPSKIVVWC